MSEVKVQPCMSKPELELFLSFVRRTSRYLEFGTGGSTYLASQLVRAKVLSVDSCRKWLERVETACDQSACKVRPTLVHVDIGKTREWGYPDEPGARERWPSYHTAVWDLSDTLDTDFFLVDGRFRVACFMQILLHCRPDAIIAIHDFESRSNYHPIRSVAREIAVTEDLSVFTPIPGQSLKQVRELLDVYRFNPA